MQNEFRRFSSCENGIFIDVTITSSLRSVVQVLMRHFTIFKSHGLSGWFVPNIAKSCLNLSKLQPKYYRSLFLWNTMYFLRPTDQIHWWILTQNGSSGAELRKDVPHSVKKTLKEKRQHSALDAYCNLTSLLVVTFTEVVCYNYDAAERDLLDSA